MIPWLFKHPSAMTPAEYREYLLCAMRVSATRQRLAYMLRWPR